MKTKYEKAQLFAKDMTITVTVDHPRSTNLTIRLVDDRQDIAITRPNVIELSTENFIAQYQIWSHASLNVKMAIRAYANICKANPHLQDVSNSTYWNRLNDFMQFHFPKFKVTPDNLDKLAENLGGYTGVRFFISDAIAYASDLSKNLVKIRCYKCKYAKSDESGRRRYCSRGEMTIEHPSEIFDAYEMLRLYPDLSISYDEDIMMAHTEYIPTALNLTIECEEFKRR